VEASGVIFAALDCDLDVIEAWNRWYDLEHTPPNVVLAGVMSSKRYVAPPGLHRARVAPEGSPWLGGRACFLTIYTLTGPPEDAFAEMSTVRESLVAADRMFADDKKAVREGDVLRTAWVVGDPALKPDDRDVPFLLHTGIVVVQRRLADGADGTVVDGWYRETWAPGAVAVPGVHGVWSLSSINRPGLALDIVMVEGDPAERARSIRAHEPHHPDAEVLVDAPFLLIDPLHYPWAAEMRASDLPATVTTPVSA
jgi:hypothetical protein